MSHSLEITPHPEGFALLRSGKPLLTPARNALVVPCESLAEAVAAEWAGLEGDKIDPLKLPLTGFCALALDVILPQRQDISEELLEYGETDLLFYRATEEIDLRRKQDKFWQPWLDWAVQRHGTIYQATYGIIPVLQDSRNHELHSKALAALSHWQLACLAVAVKCSGSLILGLAFMARRMDADQLVTLSRLEESHNMMRWGEDAEVASRGAKTRAELKSAQHWRDLLLTEKAVVAI